MEPAMHFPATPGMALFSLSPERVNGRSQAQTPRRQFLDFGRASLDLSPSRVFAAPDNELTSDFANEITENVFDTNNEFTFKSPFARSDGNFKVPSLPGSPTRHERAKSDVHSMVARFDGLNIRDADEGRKKQAAALKRAQMGREEAEAEAKKLRDEMKVMQTEVEEYKSREQRVMKRLDSMTDDLHSAKETQAHAKTLYEKEIRKAKKEAFRASSSLVQLQEELKSARNTLKSLQTELDAERAKSSRREQEAFTAQYQLVGAQEDLEEVKARMKVVEEERDALKTSLKEEEIARIAAEGRIALPAVEDENDEFASPKKKRRSSIRRSLTPPRMSLTGIAPTISQELELLREELQMQQKGRLAAEETLRHMQMECQFGCCSCKLAEQQGRFFDHDGSFDTEVIRIKDGVRGMLTPPESVKDFQNDNTRSDVLMNEEHTNLIDLTLTIPKHINLSSTSQDDLASTVMVDERPNELSKHSPAPFTEADDHAAQRQPVEHHNAINDVAEAPSTPQPQFRSTTTTTTVPLADYSSNDRPDFSEFSTPSALTREQRIEELRARRGRAKSIADTSGAVLTGAGATPATGKKVGLLDLKYELKTPRRDVSAASAPEMRKASQGMRSVSRPGVRVASK